MYKIFAILLVSALATQYVPVPAQQQGYIVGSPKPLVIEFYFDLLCPDSREQYRIFNNDFFATGHQRYQFIYHMNPLPYHKAGFPAAQGFRFLQEEWARDEELRDAAHFYAGDIFDALETLTDTATFKLTQQEILDRIYNIAVTKTWPEFKFNKEGFKAALQPGSPQNIAVRHAWKYATHRGISATPTFVVNGVIQDGAESFTAERWEAYWNKFKNPTQENDFLARFPQ